MCRVGRTMLQTVLCRRPSAADLCVVDSGYEPSWYVNDLSDLVADYCLTWREPLLTYRFYGIIVSVIGTSASHLPRHYNHSLMQFSLVRFAVLV